MKNLKVGLQLYSVRDDMSKDMDKTLSEVKKMGYDYVEFAGYYDHTADEVKAMLDKYDLKCISVHQLHDLFLEKGQEAVDFIKTIGAKYVAIPYVGSDCHKGTDKFDKTLKDLTEIAKLIKDNGLQMLYHNHEFEFEKFENKLLLDWLYDSISPDLLQTEIDTCWVKYAGYSPCDYLKKYADRSPVVHLKDFYSTKFAAGPAYNLISKDGTVDEKESKQDKSDFEFRPVGKGLMDFPAILKTLEDTNTEYVIVEQDTCTTAAPLESVKISREYLKSLGI